jgi:hypothetical protein
MTLVSRNKSGQALLVTALPVASTLAGVNAMGIEANHSPEVLDYANDNAGLDHRGRTRQRKPLQPLSGTTKVLRPLGRSRRGLWYSVNDIPPQCIRRLIGFAEVVGKSVA